MRIKSVFISGLVMLILFGSCKRKMPDSGRNVVAEIYGNYLYEDDLQRIIPSDLHRSDSASLIDKYIQGWATDILMYEKAKQNISDMTEIDRLVSEYKKTLIIHQYQRRLVEQRPSKEPQEEEIRKFYEEYGSRMTVKENMLKGLFLVVPKDVPRMKNVREWVKKADQESIENIDKYSLQNAVSYDYFMDNWLPLSTVARKAPFQINSPANFLSANSIVEVSDSAYHYFLKISEYCVVGQPEPYDLAREKIMNILSSKNSGELISEIEKELYDDAVATKELKIY